MADYDEPDITPEERARIESTPIGLLTLAEITDHIYYRDGCEYAVIWLEPDGATHRCWYTSRIHKDNAWVFVREFRELMRRRENGS